MPTQASEGIRDFFGFKADNIEQSSWVFAIIAKNQAIDVEESRKTKARHLHL